LLKTEFREGNQDYQAKEENNMIEVVINPPSVAHVAETAELVEEDEGQDKRVVQPL
jgi:hypothetical protein